MARSSELPGIRDALRTTPAPVAAVSPIIAGRAVSGPAGDLMRAHDLHPSAAGIAEAYRDFLDVLIIDQSDAGEAAKIEQFGIRAISARILMKTNEDKIELARAALDAARNMRRSQSSELSREKLSRVVMQSGLTNHNLWNGVQGGL